MIHGFITEHITGHKVKSCAQAHYEASHNVSHDTMAYKAQRLYVKTDYIFDAFRAMAKRERPCIVITHNSDHIITEKVFANRPKCVIRWYAANVGISSPDLIPLPLGCENPATPAGYSGDMGVIEHIRRKAPKKEYTLLFNMNLKTNIDERIGALEYFTGRKWVSYIKYGIDFGACMAAVAKSRFVVCPAGNGIDTHRVWESLYLGSYPVVKRSPHFEGLNDLPIVIVDSWEDVTEEYLDSWEAMAKDRPWNTDKLKMSYWKRRVQSGA